MLRVDFPATWWTEDLAPSYLYASHETWILNHVVHDNTVAMKYSHADVYVTTQSKCWPWRVQV